MSKKSIITPIYTKWGETLDKAHPLQEYPRPQLRRSSYLNINGIWSYAFTSSSEKPAEFDGEIVVPFSPEAPLSGVNRQLKPGEYLWYNRKFIIDDGFLNAHTFVNFGAVDQIAEVYVNGTMVGRHKGGYTSFSCDCTDVIHNGENEISVCVQDFTGASDCSFGKQKLDRGGIWYTAQSGIWQTVWLESVPSTYIKNVKITPMFDECSVKFEICTNVPCQEISVLIKEKQDTVAYGKADENGCCTVYMGRHFKPWNTEHPYLYDVEIFADGDVVYSYFGMRKFSTLEVNGRKVLALNNEPIFHTGLLDQGYWSDGLYTPPDDEAMIYDITVAKEYGFNMLRKHIKIEPMRWYYHCDRLGMLVWQDMVSGGDHSYNPLVIQALPYVGAMLNDTHYGSFARKSETGRGRFIEECKESVAQLYNCTCIAVWVPFNEGWGQFDAKRVYLMFKALDNTRHIDHASGWHDQKCGDFNSKHVYYKRVRLKPDDRILALTEFGGFSMPCEGNMASNIKFGYKIFDTQKELTQAYKKLFEDEVIPFTKGSGLSATVYTQLSDVEDEINGLITYDRRVKKADKSTLVELNNRLKSSLKP